MTGYFWFRRDLRLYDHKGLFEALKSGLKIQPIFIFDTEILQRFPNNDARVNFIYEQLVEIHNQLQKVGSSLRIFHGKPIDVWQQIIQESECKAVYATQDYEPSAITRDQNISNLLAKSNIPFHLVKDQVVFHKNEVVKNDGKPYTVYTPFKNKWLETVTQGDLQNYKVNFELFIKSNFSFPSKASLGIETHGIKVPNFDLNHLEDYAHQRDYPGINGTSKLSPHLRFGTVSVRDLYRKLWDNKVFVSELIWREFFMQILFHFPNSVHENFKPQYNLIQWRNDEEDFEKWCSGTTGYPIVDAGMRELNQTGNMHNRVRMIVASFLIKHLLIDWRWGEAYFAEKLLDYDQSANVGNWQWAAGTGCDAAPYFRVFNPYEQTKKFDPEFKYISKWVPEFQELTYPAPMVDHKMARERAIRVYKEGIEESKVM